MKGTKNAYFGILLLGIISLMGDIVYEGSRGVLPSYLEFLGTSALIAGLVGGLDLLGYAVRLVTGILADKTRAYWAFVFIGYGLIVSIPLLGVFTSLEIVVILVSLERLGKAFRAPSRDAILSIISKGVGVGKAFGIHELLDQIGGMLGPLLVFALMLHSNNNYQHTFSFLFLPFLVLLGVLVYAYRKIGSKTIVDTSSPRGIGEKLARPFYVYTFAVLLNTVGFIPYTLILFKASEILEPMNLQWFVPLFYLLIQGVDAPVALISGYAYDKFGTRVLVMPFMLSIFPPLLTLFTTELTMLLMASIFFGLVLGMQESIYRAAVSELTPISSRGVAYGIFNTAYGAGLLISGALCGFLMISKPPFIAVIFYVLIVQLMATFLLLSVGSKLKKRTV
ncbi:MAG: MFS transporter [Candidatus Bathyarchaeota archaeon]|nr:MFS transporter [Candidatus Bathyarchaeota archaeon]MDH5788315.1 MFS transporter [Candidatus Bathyarchaeota archaeon]